MLSGASLCRYGDGEFLIMRGKGIAFQEADDKLAQRLKEIIVSNNKNVLVGLPYLLYNPSSSLRGEIKNYCRVKAEQIRTYIDSVIDFQKEYVDTNSSQLFATYDQFDFYDYFTRVKRLWAGRDITIICGENVFKNIRHNIFLCAKSIDYQYAPSRDAYKGYTSILSQAQKIDKSRLVIIILGPTATVLAYDLSLCGYQALDFGHISKDYDWYLKGIKHKGKTLTAFFQPD
jgi:glycosyltransferase family protein